MRLSSNTIISSPLRVGLHATVAVLHLAGLLRNLTSFSKFEFMRGKFGDVTPGVLDVYRTFVEFQCTRMRKPQTETQQINFQRKSESSHRTTASFYRHSNTRHTSSRHSNGCPEATMQSAMDRLPYKPIMWTVVTKRKDCSRSQAVTLSHNDSQTMDRDVFITLAASMAESVKHRSGVCLSVQQQQQHLLWSRIKYFMQFAEICRKTLFRRAPVTPHRVVGHSRLPVQCPTYRKDDGGDRCPPRKRARKIFWT